LPGFGTLIAWASLQSLARLRRNASDQRFISFIFKPVDERQPWVLNLVSPDHENLCRTVVGLLNNLGVENKRSQVKSNEE